MRTRRNGERGVALLLTMFALMIVTAIGFSMMFQTDTETLINSNFRDQQAGYYAAAAGLEEARDRMASDAAATISNSLPPALPGNSNGVLYVINTDETIQPWDDNPSNPYFDNELCPQTVNGLDRLGETDCSGSSVPAAPTWYTSETASSSYAANPVLPYKWTRINLKKNRSAAGTANTLYVNGSGSGPENYVCWNGTNEYTSPAPCAPDLPVYIATTLAVTPSGTRRMLQYELTRGSLGIEAPGALTILGSNVSDDTSFPNSNRFTVEGADHPGCGNTSLAPSVPAITGSNSMIDDHVTEEIEENHRADNYTGSGGTTPDVQAASNLPDDYQSVDALEALLAKIKTKVTQPVITGPRTGLSNPGTSGSPQIIYVDGDLRLSGNVTGYGVLVVTGKLTLSGSIGWKGIIFVVGEGNIEVSGGGTNQIDGGLVVATTRDSSGNLLSSLGTPTFEWHGGGQGGIHYTSGCVKQANQTTDYQILSSRELMY